MQPAGTLEKRACGLSRLATVTVMSRGLRHYDKAACCGDDEREVRCVRSQTKLPPKKNHCEKEYSETTAEMKKSKASQKPDDDDELPSSRPGQQRSVAEERKKCFTNEQNVMNVLLVTHNEAPPGRTGSTRKSAPIGGT